MFAQRALGFFYTDGQRVCFVQARHHYRNFNLPAILLNLRFICYQHGFQLWGHYKISFDFIR
jgi:hypothetical protein